MADAGKASDGLTLNQANFIGTGKEGDKQGLYALENADLFNILCLPPYLAIGDVDQPLVAAAGAYCEKRRAMLLVDPPSGWTSKDAAKSGIAALGTSSKNAALFFPRLRQPNPLRDNQLEDFAPCGAVAGVFARTDTQRGVWKAPAGLDATLDGVPQLSVPLTDPENGELNPLGVNCLRRSLPPGARRLGRAHAAAAHDRLASEWKYIPVRRLALFIEESLYRGTQWVVFEPNDEPLWAQIRLNVGAFMHNLFRQGAFQGTIAARGLLRQVRQGDDDPERHQPGHRQHRGGLCAAQAGRVRHHQDPADGWPDPELKEENPWLNSPSIAQRFDPYKNFKFRVKWDGRYVAGISKVSALKRTTEVVEAPRGRRPQHHRASRPGRTEVRGHHAGARRHPRQGVRAVGQQGLELRLRPGRGGLAEGLPQGHHHRGLQRGRPAGDRLQGLPLLGLGVSRPCPISMPTPTPSPSSTSSWRTRAGSATTRLPSQARPTFTEPA